MKRIVSLIAVATMAAAMAMAQNPATSTRSRELSSTTPVSGYFLSTDGHLNRWTLVNNLASGTAMTVTQTRQSVASVTNATVGGGVLSGVGVVVTNLTVTTSNITYLTSLTTTGATTVVTGVTAINGTPVVSAPTITLQSATVAALTNVTVSVP
jgi:pantothenate kinase